MAFLLRLDEALELTALIARKAPRQHPRGRRPRAAALPEENAAAKDREDESRRVPMRSQAGRPEATSSLAGSARCTCGGAPGSRLLRRKRLSTNR
jgi:hypothetical protein